MIKYDLPCQEDLKPLFGQNDENLKLVEKKLGIIMEIEDNVVAISGDNESAKKAINIIKVLLDRISRKIDFNIEYIKYLLEDLEAGITMNEFEESLRKPLAFTFDKKLVKAKSFGQKYYINSIKNNSLTFALGPAGTGKTFLAVLSAVEALRNKTVKKIVLVRPAIEAGEQLGFLPGDLQEKIQPYIRPLYDNLYYMLGYEHVDRLIEKKVIEIAPLAYMRGRTLDDAFIILDEGQNATIEQMKMFLTRFGFNSKVVVTGDPSQNDLKKGEESGLTHSVNILSNIEGIKIVRLNNWDVVRHPLVREIIMAYDKGGI